MKMLSAKSASNADLLKTHRLWNTS